jgi:hypothetical protein
MVVLKYISATIILFAMFLHTQPHLFPYNVYVHIMGAALWSVWAYANKDKAVMLNFFPQIFILGIGVIWW